MSTNSLLSRQPVVDAARAYLGVPYDHQGRSRFGIDCCGLVVLAARGCGIEVEDARGYSRVPDGKTFLGHIEKQMLRIPLSELRPGDVLAFTFLRDPQHAAIVTQTAPVLKIIHAHMRVRKVVEHALDDAWMRKITSAYRFKGLE
jgi:cell wall-associated NlpC family hydrolase